MAAQPRPWAVLVCRFSDDVDPAKVLVKDLPGLDASAANDTETALDLFKMFFTKQGNSTFNAARYFNEMSHGTIDMNNTQVFVVNMPFTKAQGDRQNGELGNDYEIRITKAAQTAALNQGVALQNFYGIVITSHYPLDMAQGGGIPGGAVVTGGSGWPIGWAGMDYRWVRNNGIQSFGQEMGHGFGMNHSRLEGSDEDYRDRWDVMSTRGADSATDPNYGMRGPGVNAWNMRGRRWLDESRVWKAGSATFDQTIQLRPLHRHDLSGWLAAELPPPDGDGGHARYLVEYRVKEGWDAAIPRSAVLVHRFEGPIGVFLGDDNHNHSYVMPVASVGALWQSSQDAPNGGFGAWAQVGNAGGLGEVVIGHNQDGRLEAFALDAHSGSAWHAWQGARNGPFGAWHMLGNAVGLGHICVATNLDKRLEVFATDTAAGLVWHNWQLTPNGGWHGWQRLFDAVGVGQISAGRNLDGRLEVFATDTAAGLAWHNWQTTPNGNWHGWQRLFDAAGLGAITVASNQDGRLEAFALDRNEGSAWHTWQKTPNGSWGGWQIMGNLRGLQRIVVANNQDERIEIFATDKSSGAVWHSWQTAPNGGWHDWQRLGTGVGLAALAVERNQDGRLEVFALDTSARFCWHAAQTSANAPFGDWSIAGDQHVGFTAVAVAAQFDGSLQLVAVDSQGHADLAAGESGTLVAVPGFKASVQVIGIDDVNHIATVRLIYSVA